MNDLILDFHNVTKRYGTKRSGTQTAVDNATFSLERGRIYGFVGENGAGKTTCIRMMCGLSEPDEGKIELFGTKCCNGDAKTIAALRRKIGSLVEQPVLNPFVTARENLIERYILFGTYSGSLDSHITEILERTGLGDTGKKKVRDFSLGMRQRLGIALALITNPELLILDEPMNGLDPMGMISIRHLIQSLCRDDGITVLISSHILSELEELATDYIFISHGKILKTARTEEVCVKGKSLEDFYMEILGVTETGTITSGGLNA